MWIATSETSRPIPQNNAIVTSGCPWDFLDETDAVEVVAATRTAFVISTLQMRQ
jgi:hypothetical protein